MYKDKKYLIDKLITFLNNELKCEFFSYNVVDLHGNEANLIIKKGSKIFKNEIENREYLKLNVEELIDNRFYDNKDEIIIFDLNSDEEYTDLEYIKESLKYHFLSYSNSIKEILKSFVKYVIEKNV